MNSATTELTRTYQDQKLNKYIISAGVLVLLLAGCLRLIGLENCPNGFFRDEVEKGYNSWALSVTGAVLNIDARGGLAWERLPWMVNVMGTQTSAIYHYLSVPFVKMGGLSIRSTRMASAWVGLLTVLLLTWLVGCILGWSTAIFAGTWLAFMPWHLVFSRWALQGILAPLLIVVTLLGLYGFERGRKWGLPLALGSLGLLFYSYSGVQPFVVVWSVCLLLIYRKRMPWKHPMTWVALILFFIPVIPTLFVRLEAGGLDRMQRIAIWDDTESISVILGRFVRNYLAHLDPRFLFISGDAHPRHSPPMLGQLLKADIVLLPIGLVYAIRKRMMMTAPLLTALLCGAVPAALTREGVPHALRSISMLIPCVIFSAAGFALIVKWLGRSLPAPRSRLMLSLIILTCLVSGVAGSCRTLKFYARAPLARQAFQDGQCEAWKTISTARKPHESVYAEVLLPYGHYYQLFFADRRSPVSVVENGLSATGFYIHDFRYEDPAGRLQSGTIYWELVRQPPSALWKGDEVAMFNAVRSTNEAWARVTREVAD